MKKIHSEINLYDDDFKVKVCTIDKKNPEAIYIELGSYIMPTENKESFTESIDAIEKDVRKFTKEMIKENPLCEENFIFVSDVASERMSVGKRSYLEMMVFLRPSGACMTETCRNFKKITEEVNNKYVSKILPHIKDTMAGEGFKCYKTKN